MGESREDSRRDIDNVNGLSDQQRENMIRGKCICCRTQSGTTEYDNKWIYATAIELSHDEHSLRGKMRDTDMWFKVAT